VPGGLGDSARGDYSLAAGREVKVADAGDYSLAFGRDFTTRTPNAVVFCHPEGATRLGVGVANPDHSIHVHGGAYCNGTNWIDGSSRRLKYDIRSLTADDYARVLAILDKTSIVRFRYKSDPNGERHIGLIAEDAPEELATPNRDGVNTADAIGFLLAALKAQNAEIEALKAELSKMKNK
jgi:hypothetical protein